MTSRRVYLAVDAEALKVLASGARVTGPVFEAETEDEEDELAALDAASENGPVVVAADVERPEDGVTIDAVASFHIDIDGSGHLAWFATQEIDTVLRELHRH